MLKPIRWNTFIRDFFVIQLGFLLYGFAIALIVRADLGTGTWLVLEVALANILGDKDRNHDRLHGLYHPDPCACFA